MSPFSPAQAEPVFESLDHCQPIKKYQACRHRLLPETACKACYNQIAPLFVTKSNGAAQQQRVPLPGFTLDPAAKKRKVYAGRHGLLEALWRPGP